MPTFTCDFSQTPTQLDHFWEHTFGSGHAPLALRADWQAQLQQCHKELGAGHVRFHAILSDQMGTLICQDEEYLYSFFNADKIMDFLLSIGMKPFVELSFMPATLSSGNQIVFHYQANVTPPRDYGDWATLIHKLVGHWVERYGAREVSQWFFEVWNEPNLQAFWTGTQADYFNLYRHTADPIKSVDGALRVGGPATAQSAWVPEFLEFCEKEKLPADFISTHYYPTDAFGQIGADTETQLAHAPRDVMRQKAQEVHDQAGGRPVYYTEWSISSNPRDPFHDEPFAAAYIIHILMNVSGLVQGYSYWTFSDIFEENYFPSIPFQGGFGLLNIHGIPKPAYRAYELMHNLGTQQLAIQGTHDNVEAYVVKKENGATVLITNHAQPRHTIQTEPVHIELEHAPEPRTAYLERIDDDHANPRCVWVEMGEPKYLSPFDVDRLKVASQLVKEPIGWKYEGGTLQLDVAVPPHGVAAITLEMPAEQQGQPAQK